MEGEISNKYKLLEFSTGQNFSREQRKKQPDWLATNTATSPCIQSHSLFARSRGKIAMWKTNFTFFFSGIQAYQGQCHLPSVEYFPLPIPIRSVHPPFRIPMFRPPVGLDGRVICADLLRW
jgi:hypothetical protein